MLSGTGSTRPLNKIYCIISADATHLYSPVILITQAFPAYLTCRLAQCRPTGVEECEILCSLSCAYVALR